MGDGVCHIETMQCCFSGLDVNIHIHVGEKTTTSINKRCHKGVKPLAQNCLYAAYKSLM